MKHKILGVYQGTVKQNFGMKTAIEKSLVKGDACLTFQGLKGDECAEIRFHGGPERALHQYPSEHYTYWRKHFGEHHQWQAPGVGENISSEGMLESNVCIGDCYRWGTAIIEVSQPRSPCFKLNKRWNINGFAENMQSNGRCGWLYRVIKPGIVNRSLPLELIERVNNAMTVHDVSDIFFNQPLSATGLKKLASQERLSKSWMTKVTARLASNEVENWHFRLNGKP